MIRAKCECLSGVDVCMSSWIRNSLSTCVNNEYTPSNSTTHTPAIWPTQKGSHQMRCVRAAFTYWPSKLSVEPTNRRTHGTCCRTLDCYMYPISCIDRLPLFFDKQQYLIRHDFWLPSSPSDSPVRWDVFVVMSSSMAQRTTQSIQIRVRNKRNRHINMHHVAIVVWSISRADWQNYVMCARVHVWLPMFAERGNINCRKQQQQQQQLHHLLKPRRIASSAMRPPSVRTVVRELLYELCAVFVAGSHCFSAVAFIQGASSKLL